MLTTSIRRILVASFITIAALGVSAGVATADTPNTSNRDNARLVCGPNDILVEDDDPNGSTTCYQKTITTSCDPKECVIITDDPRLSSQPNGARGHAKLAS